MTSSVTIDCATADGKTLAALGDMIAARTQWLKETTSQAVVATAINVLSSVRPLTKVADPKKDTGMVTVAPYPSLYVSFRRLGKKNILCIRPVGKTADGKPLPHLRGVPWANATGAVGPGIHKSTSVFIAQDRRSASEKGTSKRYYLIAHNIEEATAYAEARRKRRIELHAGLAKWLLGVAQAHISDAAVNNINVTDAARKIGATALTTMFNSSGFSRGEVFLFVHDKLKYALLALKGGPSDFQLAMQRAANRTVGIIHHTSDRPFAERLPTPFPEVQRRK